MSVGNDGMVKLISLYSIILYSYVLFSQFRGGRANEVSDFTYP